MKKGKNDKEIIENKEIRKSKNLKKTKKNILITTRNEKPSKIN
jgi:hypothetical protein